MNKKLEKRIRLKRKIRAKIVGQADRPRLSVFRSNKFIYAQAIDDALGVTIVSVSDMPTKGQKVAKGENKTERAKKAGKSVAEALLSKGIKKCVFDRNGFNYTGRVKALADSAREAGLQF
jgi:large subunit ribosomal protein L18